MGIPPEPPSKIDTLKALLSSSERRVVPVRNTFLQLRDVNGKPLAGPLASLVRRGVASTFEQYLLLHARAVGRPDDETDDMHFDVYLESRVWARALGLYDDESGLRTVHRNWAALSRLRLVAVDRSGRFPRVTLLREDGSGEPYTHPGRTRDTAYLKLPHDYWLEGHADNLRVPGKAMLLISMARPDWFSLPFKKGPVWYGIGSSTVERGLRELRQAGYLEVYEGWRQAPLTSRGWTQDWRYRLCPPFGPHRKIAKSAPRELSGLLFASARARPSHQADSDADTRKRRRPAAGTAKSRAPKPARKSPALQPGAATGKPKRRIPAVTRSKGRRLVGPG